MLWWVRGPPTSWGVDRSPDKALGRRLNPKWKPHPLCLRPTVRIEAPEFCSFHCIQGWGQLTNWPRDTACSVGRPPRVPGLWRVWGLTPAFRRMRDGISCQLSRLPSKPEDMSRKKHKLKNHAPPPIFEHFFSDVLQKVPRQ